ncbi:DHA2 family efflux MFS transporter permease subunit [Streptomyces sp. CB03238]|uniref:DHA2 family efflux MFS transporter permease subunit n=1 Tax=Streptomyces sp. CB03238 TaxID=1907777 RepID=UPI001F4E6207|nr:DHA2 family efflux MFS transporter permease subunit [Streptomyces sp. CB03238]
MQQLAGQDPDETVADATRTPGGRRWLALAVLVLAQLTVWLDNTILNVALKTLADPVEGLGATTNELQWSISSYTLIFAVMLFSGGVLGDRYGHRRLLLIGTLIFAASSFWAGLCDSPAELITARGAMGVGSALIMPATLSLIAAVFDARERAMAIAIWSGSSGLAIAAGPLVGGALLERFWWGSVFLVNVPLAAITLVGAVLLLPAARDASRTKLDPLGVLLSTAGLLALVYGLIEGGHRNEWTSPGVLGPIAGGILVLAVFVLVELRVTTPSLDVRLFRNARFTGATTSVMLTYFSLSGSMFYTAFYLQGVRGQTPFEAGLNLLPVAVGVVLGAPLSAALVRRLGLGAVVCVAMVVAALTFLAYIQLDVETGMAYFWLLMLVQGAALGAAMAPTTEAVMAVLPEDRTGAGSAVNNSMRQIGGVLGVAILDSRSRRPCGSTRRSTCSPGRPLRTWTCSDTASRPARRSSSARTRSTGALTTSPIRSASTPTGSLRTARRSFRATPICRSARATGSASGTTTRCWAATWPSPLSPARCA